MWCCPDKCVWLKCECVIIQILICYAILSILRMRLKNVRKITYLLRIGTISTLCSKYFLKFLWTFLRTVLRCFLCVWDWKIFVKNCVFVQKICSKIYFCNFFAQLRTRTTLRALVQLWAQLYTNTLYDLLYQLHA